MPAADSPVQPSAVSPGVMAVPCVRSKPGLVARTVELWRYHGIWSLGIRLFRNISFVSKAAIVSGVFLAVVAQLAFLFLRSTNQSIDVSQRELVGLAYVRDIAPVLLQAQDLRRMLHQSGGKTTAEVDATLGHIGSQLGKLVSRDVPGLSLAEPLKFALDAFEPLKKGGDDAEDAFNRVDNFAQQVLRLTTSVADSSGLSLDPDLDSYHLMLASTGENLQAINMLGRMRDLGADAVAKGAVTPFQRNILQGDSYVMYRQLEGMFARYERVVKANGATAATLGFEEVFKPANIFMRSVRKGPLAESLVASDATAFSAAGQAAMDSLSALTTRSYATLEGLITARIHAQRAARNMQLLLILAGLLVAAYLFHCFYLVTRGGMRELTSHIDAMARGDLSTSPNPWGLDEAAQLMRSIAAMQDAMRTLIGQVNRCAADVLTASTEVSSAGQDLAQRTAQSANSLQHTATAMQQIGHAVGHTADRVRESATLGQDNARVAALGGEVIAQVVSTMQDIQTSSKKVGDILSLIDSIAFQTNILALNAAVEAARAGEQGRGFAVVAAEVRGLAQRSASAAREIKGLISQSSEQITHGTQVVQAAGDTMAQLVGNAQKMSALLAQASTAAVEQIRGVGEVSSAVTRLDEDTQRNAALVEQTSASAMSMQQMATELAATASRFRLPDGR